MSCYDETGKIMFCIICNSDLEHILFVSSSEWKTFSSQIYQTHHFLYRWLNICIRNQWSHMRNNSIRHANALLLLSHILTLESWERGVYLCLCVWWQIIELFRFDLKWNVFKWNQFEIRIHLRIMCVSVLFYSRSCWFQMKCFLGKGVRADQIWKCCDEC